ncbi:uncharacterized protein LOC144622550 isoform X2 [Crassostrea virginica]
MRTAAFLAVLVIGVVLAQESSFGTCRYWINSGELWISCYKPQFTCDAALQTLDDWCDARLNRQIKADKENIEFLQKRALAFDLTNCLKARNQVDCDARNNCFWFRGNDCIPRDLVP